MLRDSLAKCRIIDRDDGQLTCIINDTCLSKKTVVKWNSDVSHLVYKF